MNLNKTRNDVQSNTTTTVIAILNAQVSEAIDLALMTKHAHWNLKGPQFISVHKMLDGFRTEIDGHVDTMAERVVQLGGVALGTTQTILRDSRLKSYPVNLVSVEDHIAALEQRYGAVANSLRAAIDAADGAADKGTADIFTAASRTLDKALWFLQAHTINKA